MGQTGSEMEIEDTPEGSVLSLRAVPRASRTGLAPAPGSGGVRVRLAAAPLEGAANAELVRFLARLLGVARSDVEILSGRRSRNKRVLLRGLPADRVRRILAEASRK